MLLCIIMIMMIYNNDNDDDDDDYNRLKVKSCRTILHKKKMNQPERLMFTKIKICSNDKFKRYRCSEIPMYRGTISGY
jgi:hypothetical protein